MRDLVIRKVPFVEVKKINQIPRIGTSTIVERKEDGFRVMFYKRGKDSYLLSTHDNQIFPETATAIGKELKVRSVTLDGELVVPDPVTQQSVFLAMRKKGVHHMLRVFDIVELNDKSLTSLRLTERKEILQGLIRTTMHVELVPFYHGREAALQIMNWQQQNHEGVIVKESSDMYTSSARWYKYFFERYNRHLAFYYFMAHSLELELKHPKRR